MLRPYLKIWKWEWIFGRAVKAISSPGVRSLCVWAKRWLPFAHSCIYFAKAESFLKLYFYIYFLCHTVFSRNILWYCFNFLLQKSMKISWKIRSLSGPFWVRQAQREVVKFFVYFSYWASSTPWGHVLSLKTFGWNPALRWAIRY